MEDSKLYAIACRLRPELNRLEGQDRLQAYLAMVPFLLTWPFALIGLALLVYLSEWRLIIDYWPTFAILFLVGVIIRRQTFSLPIKLADGSTVSVTSSLSPLVVWAGMFIFGPTALWPPLFAAIVGTLGLAWQHSRQNQDPFWYPLSQLLQGITSIAFVNSIALYGYTLSGGAYPLTELSLETLIPATVAILIGALLPALIFLPTIFYINKLTSGKVSLNSLASFMASVVAITLIIAPFSLLPSITYARDSPGLFVISLVGLVLVNALVHYLSQARERSEQRSRELTRLEELSEAIIEMPPDASTLETLLTEYTPRMFPEDIVEIRLLDPDGDIGAEAPVDWEWPVFDLVFPESQARVNDVVWERLLGWDGGYLIVRDVTLPNARAAYGDAVVAKILLTAPGEETTEGCAIGGVYLLRNGHNGKVDDSLPVAQALASQIGSALYRAQVHEANLAHQKVVQELAFAGRIQASFLPREVPEIDGWDFSATLEPARQTSGDFYDFIPLSGNRLGLLIADVADKGMGAALYMAMSRTIIRSFAMQHEADPARVLSAANERILSDTQSDQFVTLFYGVLELDSGRLTYCNAGHNPPFLLSPDPDTGPTLLKRTGIPLGIFDDMDWRQEQVQIRPHDLLLLYTDGVTEAQNAGRAFFEDERLLAVAEANQGRSAREIEDAVLAAVHAFVGEAPQFDDITLMIVVRDQYTSA